MWTESVMNTLTHTHTHTAAPRDQVGNVMGDGDTVQTEVVNSACLIWSGMKELLEQTL